MAAPASCSTRRSSLADRQGTCAVHHLHRAANSAHGSCRAGQPTGCALGNSQVVARTRMLCSDCLCTCACRVGMLVAVLSACVSSDGCESWYLCRSVSGDNSVLASGAPERCFVIREAAAQIAHYPRKRVNTSKISKKTVIRTSIPYGSSPSTYDRDACTCG